MLMVSDDTGVPYVSAGAMKKYRDDLSLYYAVLILSLMEKQLDILSHKDPCSTQKISMQYLNATLLPGYRFFLPEDLTARRFKLVAQPNSLINWSQGRQAQDLKPAIGLFSVSTSSWI